MPRERTPAGESLVVLTRDAALAETLKTLGTGHTLITVASGADLADELLGKLTGVAIIDGHPVDQRVRLRMKFALEK